MATQDDYLKTLLGKHETKGRMTRNYLKKAQQAYEQQIKSGRYQIKQGQNIQLRKDHHSLSRAQAQNLKYMKRNLQQNLDLIDSRVNQLTQPQKKSRVLDQNERRKFVSQMVKQRKSTEKKRKQMMELDKQKSKQKQQKLQQEIKRKQQQSRQKRKQQLLKRTQSFQLSKKNRQIQLERTNKLLKQKMQQKILSQRILQKYKQNQQSNLQQRKKKLAEIRSIHKPLTRSQFQLHLQKIQRLKSQKDKSNSTSSRYMSGSNVNNIKVYKSAWYKKVQQEPVIFEDKKHEDELYQIKEMKDKLKKYSEYVKHNFKPETSHKKSNLKEEKKNKSAMTSPKTEDLREIGLKYLQFSKEHGDTSKKDKENGQQQEAPKRIKQINYLEELKQKHKNNPSAQQYVQSIRNKKGLSQAQKAQKILNYIQGVQRKAKMRQQKGKINNNMVDEQLDNLYMQAIAVKLSMLNNNQ